jgi:mannonate dehydratase
MKISMQLRSNFGDDDLTFARQLGVDYVSVGTTGGTYEQFAAIKARVEAAGLNVANIGNTNVHNMPAVTLNLPGRDEKIAQYKEYIRALGRLGIDYTTYAHMGNGIWSSPRATTRGDASARHVDLSTAHGYWVGDEFVPPLTHGRRYSEDELWDNYTHFIRQVAPVAEEAGVRIGMHPDDPPAVELGGIPRCVLGTYDGFVRALEIADSPNVGVCLCLGTWLEGGDQMGKSAAEAARAFAGLGKLWKIHFRNVSAPLPTFTETFVDDGYADMRALMRTLVALDFDGILIADHVPEMVGDSRTGWAYSLGYIKALRDMAVDART